ncbi:MAG: esterase FrsA [Aeromonadaceae bacterium]|nr:esterase FrsA [Aeromonadaceae bacterium]MBP8064620.1 esterase FrsA [Aeromonadaceae bacterium]MBP9569259.1 esterase FrsA [Aeromonadaceae bacterium]
MQEEEALNLSERLFSKVRKVQETSTISNSAGALGEHEGEQVLIEGICSNAWYRIIRRSYWIWQGADPIELEDILSHIATGTGVRSREEKLDTLQGYAPGNWIYEFSQVAGEYFKKGKSLEQEGDLSGARKAYLRATRYYSIASYPHLKGDELAEQAQLQGNQAYREAGRLMPVPLKILTIPFRDKEINGYLHLPTDAHVVPVVMVSGSIDSLQIDFYRFYEQYLAPNGIGMLTLDMPGIGYSSQFPLVQDTSRLHQAALHYLREEVPFVDNQRIGMVGVRLGGNVAARLAYLEPTHLKTVACIGPGLNQFFVEPELFNQASPMLRASLANRLGMDAANWNELQPQCQIFSLKRQGLVGVTRTRVPILSIGHRRDFICPESDIRTLASSSHYGKAIVLDKLPVMKVFDRALSETCDWLKLHFNI